MAYSFLKFPLQNIYPQLDDQNLFYIPDWQWLFYDFKIFSQKYLYFLVPKQNWPHWKVAFLNAASRSLEVGPTSYFILTYILESILWPVDPEIIYPSISLIFLSLAYSVFCGFFGFSISPAQLCTQRRSNHYLAAEDWPRLYQEA